MSSRRRDRDRGGARSLHVRGYDVPSTGDRELRQVFEKFGNVVDVYLPKDYFTKQYRGFAYIQFANEGDADEARKKLDHTDIFNDGREVHIMWAAGERKSPGDMRRLDIERDNPHARRERERAGAPPWPRDRSPRRFGPRGGTTDDVDRDRYPRKRFRSPSPSSRYRRDRSPPRRRRNSRSPRRPRSRSPQRRSGSPAFRRRGSPGARRSRSPPHQRRRSRSPGLRAARRSRSPMRGRRSSRSPPPRRSRSPVGRRGPGRYSPRRPSSRSPPLNRRASSRSPPPGRRPSSRSPPPGKRPSSRSPPLGRRPSSRSPPPNRRATSRSPPLKRRVHSRSPVRKGEDPMVNGHGNGSVPLAPGKSSGNSMGNSTGNGPLPGGHALPKLRSEPLSPNETTNPSNSTH